MPFVVGIVESCEEISAKLKKLSVNVGGGEPLTIVTNASNVREGTRTCVALIGTVVEDVEVKKMTVSARQSMAKQIEDDLVDAEVQKKNAALAELKRKYAAKPPAGQ